MKLISKTDKLPIGTKVRVGNRFGEVQSVNVVGDKITHTVKFTHQQFSQSQRYRTDPPKFNMVEIMPKVEVIKYFAIMVLDKEK